MIYPNFDDGTCSDAEWPEPVTIGGKTYVYVQNQGHSDWRGGQAVTREDMGIIDTPAARQVGWFWTLWILIAAGAVAWAWLKVVL